MSRFVRSLVSTQRSIVNSATVRRFTEASSSAPLKSKEDIERMVKSDKIVVFIKGTAQEPLCGFSRAVVQILGMHDVRFKDYNVLEDESLRQGLKVYSNWPTFPQVFVDGKLIGGADILYEMHKNKDLDDVFEQAGVQTATKPTDDKSKKNEK